MRGRRLSAIIAAAARLRRRGLWWRRRHRVPGPGPAGGRRAAGRDVEPAATPEGDGTGSDATQDEDSTSDDGAATGDGTATPEEAAPRRRHRRHDAGHERRATAPETPADSPTNDTEPPAGSEARAVRGLLRRRTPAPAESRRPSRRPIPRVALVVGKAQPYSNPLHARARRRHNARCTASRRAATEARTPADVGAALTRRCGRRSSAHQVHCIEVARRTAAGGEGPCRWPRRPGYDMRLDSRPVGRRARGRDRRERCTCPTRARPSIMRAELVEHFDVASALFVPVSLGGEVRRVALVISHTPRTFTDAEIAEAETLAQVAATGLARLDAEHRRSARAAHDRALVRAARALNMSLELPEVLPRCRARRRWPSAPTCPGSTSADGKEGGVATAGHNVAGRAGTGPCSAPGEGAAGAGAAHRQAVRHQRLPTRCRWPPSLSGFRTAIAVPMRWNDELKGALSVGWTTMRRVEEEDRRTLEAIADLATVACHNAETYHQVEQAARTDALTGLLNHGAMQVRVREEIARARRDKHAAELRDHRPRRLQARQRPARPPGRRRAAAPGRRAAARRAAALRPGGPLRRRRVRAPAPRQRRGDRHRRRRARPRRDGGLDGRRLLARRRPVARAARRRRPARARRPRAPAGQADRQGPRRRRQPDVERELAMLQAQQGSPAAVQALAAAIEERDNYTHEHSEEVVHLARGVAMLLGLQTDQAERIAHAALLHDVGKLAVPNEILHKPGPLTPEEWEVMAEHPVAGERILLRIPDLTGDRARGPPRARALGRQRLPGRPRGPADPDRLADHPRLRRLPRDDHRPPLPRRRCHPTRRPRNCATACARSSTPTSSRRCSTCSATTARRCRTAPAHVRMPAAPPPRPSGGRARPLALLRLLPAGLFGFGSVISVGAVGQPRLVEAAVLRALVHPRLRRLRVGVVALVLRAARAPRGAVLDELRQRRRPASGP